MAKQDKQSGDGWQFPKALEIVKCKEGNKEFMKERPRAAPLGIRFLCANTRLTGSRRQSRTGN